MTCGTCPYDCSVQGDSETWHKNGEEAKDCAWAAGYYYNRASVIGEDGTLAYESCPEATRRCFYGTCADSATWHKKDQPWKDCAWAAAATSRCIAVGADDTYGFESCPAACLACAGAQDCDSDDVAWYKKNAPSKDCAWVAKDAPARCTVKGEDDAWGFQACPGACGLCDG